MPVADFARVAIQAKDETRSAADSAARNLQRVQGVATGLNRVLGAVGVGVSLAGLVSFTKSAIDSADALSKLSSRTGVAVRDLATFKQAGELADVPLDKLGESLAKLNISLGEAANGNKTYQDTLRQLGVTAKDPTEAMFQIADAVQRIQDPTRRAYLLNKVFGESYRNLLPLLEQGGAGLRSQADASKAYADGMERSAAQAALFNDNLTRLKQSTDSLAISIVGKTLPAVNEWVSATDKLIERHGTLIGVLASVGAAALPGISASALAGSSSIERVREKLEESRKELEHIDAAVKSGTFGLIQLAIYGSESEMKRKGEYLRNNIKTLENGIKQFEGRQAKARGNGNGGTQDDLARLQCESSGGTWDGKTCKRRTPKTASADPLKSLLDSTEIGQLKAFDAQVAQLNARFAGGAKNPELYAQAMTALIEKTPLFAGRISEANAALAAQQAALDGLLADTNQAKTEAFAAKVQLLDDAFFAGRISAEQHDQAIAKVSGTYEDATARLQAFLDATPSTRLEKQRNDMLFLADALQKKTITEQQYIEAVQASLGTAGDAAQQQSDQFGEFARKAAESIQSSIADFLIHPFDNGLKGLAGSFADTLQRMAADAVAADLAGKLFGNYDSTGQIGGLVGSLVPSGGGGGGAGLLSLASAIPSLAGSDQNLLGSIASLFGFENGGVMTSRGPLPLHAYASGGIADRPQLALFGEGRMNEAYVPLPDGRRIPVAMQGGGNSGTVNHINVTVQASPTMSRETTLQQGRRYGAGIREALARNG